MAKANQIEIDSTGLYYQGSKFPYQAVDSLRYYYVITKKTVNFVPAGTDYNAELDIYLATLTNPIVIRTGSLMGFLGMNRGEGQANPVMRLYQQLSQHTYQIRLTKYVEKFEKQGYIYYDNKKIFKDGTVSDGQREINLTKNIRLRKSPFELIHPSPDSFTKVIKEELFGKRQDFVISTQFDSDVFFTILAMYFNLRFEAEEKDIADDIQVEVPITPEQAANGVQLDVEVARKEICDACNGLGASHDFSPPSLLKCTTCYGMRRVERTHKFAIKIPSGIADGQRLRLREQGNAGLDGNKSGDLYIKVSIKTSP